MQAGKTRLHFVSSLDRPVERPSPAPFSVGGELQGARSMRTLVQVMLVAVGVGGAVVQGGECATPRQYYSAWQKPAGAEYPYRTYYYKPSADYAGYKHHYVILKDDHCYYYNPYEKKVWGRCHAQHQGKPQYQLLAPKDRRPTIAEIPETAFPPAAALPPIPESRDNQQLDLPPDDLPAEVFSPR